MKSEWFRRAAVRVVSVAVLLSAGTAVSPSRAADEAPVDTASLPRGGESGSAPARLPRLLSDEDAGLYASIFELQEDGNWPAADALVARLDDRLLMGHVLYQRYMHPTKYRSRYVELKDWMASYADHPGARAIYRLALRRQPANWRAPQRPLGVSFGPLASNAEAEENGVRTRKASDRIGTAAQRRLARTVETRVKAKVRRGWPTGALEYLERPEIRRGLHPVAYDRALALVARGYYHAGLDDKALDAASRAIERTGAEVPMALWWGGLAAFRSKDHARAARWFEMLVAADSVDEWIASAAAFWAARANLAARRPERVNLMLERSATHPRTFYGLLASRALGEIPTFEWALPKLGEVEMDLLSQAPAAKRALALIQASEASRAESELKRFTGNMSPDLARILLGLTAAANLPELAYRLGHLVARDGGLRYDAVLWPVPDWMPASGYSVDRALIFALIRQESGFKPRARSRSGASGLMQLMPRTAGHIAQRRFRGSALRELFEPEYNIELGQQYIQRLIGFPEIEGNLFYAAAAYNGGPGNLRKWRRKAVYDDDPLLFIESIPSRETRAFVERVLTNFWIYRFRLDQPTPSLDAVAAGTWPRYNRLDTDGETIVSNAETSEADPRDADK